jgi:hypothetical protein
MLFWGTGILSGSLADWNTIVALIGIFAFFAPLGGLIDTSEGTCRDLAIWWVGSAVIALLGLPGAILLTVIAIVLVLWNNFG